MTDWQQRQTGYTYDDEGRLAQIADPNGVTSALSHAAAGRLTGIAYALDPAGKRTQLQDSAGTTTWAYDALDRLTGASYPTATR